MGVDCARLQQIGASSSVQPNLPRWFLSPQQPDKMVTGVRVTEGAGLQGYLHHGCCRQRGAGY